MMARAMYLLLLFVPVAVTAPLCILLGWRRPYWLHLMRWTLERAGESLNSSSLSAFVVRCGRQKRALALFFSMFSPSCMQYFIWVTGVH